jgi:hypothetical protein
MNRIVAAIIGAGLLSCTLSSCKIFKRKPGKKQKAQTEAQARLLDSAGKALKNDLALVDTNELMKKRLAELSPLWLRTAELNTFSTKAKMHYEGGDKSYDFIANIRIKKDSIIWVSVSVAGIVQVARAIITPDSFRAILYTEKQAFEGPISKVNSIMPAGLDFYSLQNILLGNTVLHDAVAVSVTEGNPNWIVRLQKENYIEQAEFDHSDSTLRKSQVVTQGVSNKSLSHTLSNFGMFGKLRLATDRVLYVLSDSSAMTIDMNYSNITINEEQTYPFSIPKNYMMKQ